MKWKNLETRRVTRLYTIESRAARTNKKEDATFRRYGINQQR